MKLLPAKAQFQVSQYDDGSGPVATVAYDTTSEHTPEMVWLYSGDDSSGRWVAFDWRHADAIADAIKAAAASLRSRAHPLEGGNV